MICTWEKLKNSLFVTLIFKAYFFPAWPLEAKRPTEVFPRYALTILPNNVVKN